MVFVGILVSADNDIPNDNFYTGVRSRLLSLRRFFHNDGRKIRSSFSNQTSVSEPLAPIVNLPPRDRVTSRDLGNTGALP